MEPSFATRVQRAFVRKYQRFLDESVPWAVCRWSALFGISALYIFRIWYVNHFFGYAFEVLTYGIFIYTLKLFIDFITPQDENEISDSNNLDDEFRPFQRKLPEFKFWKGLISCLFISLFLTAFPILSIPVFWPILVMYAIVLFICTMQKRIRHMIKFNYVPFSFGKKTYGKSETEKTTKKVRPPVRTAPRTADLSRISKFSKASNK